MCDNILAVCNNIADLLSHFLMGEITVAPKANPLPDHIPAWPTQTFTAASCNAGIMVLPSLPDKHTDQGLQSFTHFTTNTPSPHFQHHL